MIEASRRSITWLDNYHQSALNNNGLLSYICSERRYTLPALVYTGLAGTGYDLLEISE